MANVNCTVYFREHGSSKIYAVEKAKGRVGSYGIRWYEGDRQRQKIVGQYPAVAAKLKKELELKKNRQKATSIVRPDESMKLDTAIDLFIREREDPNADSARRWRLELDLFKEQSGHPRWRLTQFKKQKAGVHSASRPETAAETVWVLGASNPLWLTISFVRNPNRSASANCKTDYKKVPLSACARSARL